MGFNEISAWDRMARWHCSSAGVKEQSKCFFLTSVRLWLESYATSQKQSGRFTVYMQWLLCGWLQSYTIVMWMTANRLNGGGSLSNRGICIWWAYQITDGRMQLNTTTGSQDSWDRKALQKQNHPEQVAKGCIRSMCTYLQGWRLHNLSWQLVPVFDLPDNTEDFFLLFKWNFLCFSLRCCLLSYWAPTGKGLAPSSLLPLIGICYKH